MLDTLIFVVGFVLGMAATALGARIARLLRRRDEEATDGQS